jgi:hypothetical protein
MNEVVVRASFQVWDHVRHGTVVYEHGPGGLVICPVEVAAPLLHNGGYAAATTADLQNEIDLLEGRAAILRSHL